MVRSKLLRKLIKFSRYAGRSFKFKGETGFDELVLGRKPKRLGGRGIYARKRKRRFDFSRERGIYRVKR